MPADLTHAHQRGLCDEEDHPTRESGTVNPEQDGPRRRGVDEIGVDRAAEAPHDHPGEKQGHCEIEISAQEPFELVLTCSFFHDDTRPELVRDDHRDWHRDSLKAGWTKWQLGHP